MKYLNLSFPAYIALENCEDFGFDPVYGENGNQIPRKKDVVAVAKKIAFDNEIKLTGFDWDTDETGWWYLGFRETVSFEIENCDGIDSCLLLEDYDLSEFFKIADFNGHPHFFKSTEPRGLVCGKFQWGMDDEGDEALFFDNFALQE